MQLRIRQLRALIWKDFLLSFSNGNAKYTICRAFVAPIILAIVMVTAFRLFFSTGTYGIGPTNPVRSLIDGMNAATHGRETLVLINTSGFVNGDIDRVIDIVAKPVKAAGKKVLIGNSTDQLRQTCRSTLAGTTKCYAAAIFHASPKEGFRKSWYYSLRADAALGGSVDMTQSHNDGQVYVLPLQHAIDVAIGSINGTILPSTVNEYPFTSLTEERFRRKSTLNLVRLNMNTTGCVWVLTLIGVLYHLVQIITEERESEISNLIEAMMPNKRRWECQAIRILAHHLAFDMIYGISWIVIGGIVKAGLFQKSNAAIIIFGFILSGLAFVSFSIFGAVFFRRSQLSGIVVLVFAVTVTVVGQTTGKWMGTAGISILSLLFTPIAFVEFFIICARYEYQEVPVNLGSRAPSNPWQLPGIVFFVFFAIQILVYPLLAALLERRFYGTAAERTGRSVMWSSQPNDSSSQPTESSTQLTDNPIQLINFTKVYKRHWFPKTVLTLIGRKPAPIYAVRDLTLRALKGQIMVLLGANGCGKSSTLNSIAGLSSISKGEIIVDGAGGIGLCPQKTVLWNSLSVLQHAQIFNRLKSMTDQDIDKDVYSLIKSCGLDKKIETSSCNLSGGQKRKLQLVLMLTGGSRVCAVDEVSSGLDPISRRKIWDILLAERGKRTIVLTTHFLDEAEFLADHVVVMSKGQLKDQGSVSELKSRLGNGYRIQRLFPADSESMDKTVHGDDYGEIETVGTASDVLSVIKRLDQEGVSDYQINGPTFEEVFLRLAADSDMECEDDFDPGEKPGESSGAAVAHKNEFQNPVSQKTDSVPRVRTARWHQIWILFKNRWTVFKRNPAVLLSPLVLPIIASRLVLPLINYFDTSGCDLQHQSSISTLLALDLSRGNGAQFILGPPSAFAPQTLQLLSSSVKTMAFYYSNRNFSIVPYVHFVSSLQEFDQFTKSNQSTVNPGGIWMGDSSTTFNYRSDIGPLGVFNALFVQSLVNSLLLNSSIAADYSVFDFPLANGTGDILQLVFYFGLVMAFIPSFFALYPSRDRIRNIRAMKYSNGVKPFELWFAYALFDWIFILLASTFIVIIFATVTPGAWYGIGYLFAVLCLYGLASLLLSYAISLYSKSGLAAFALMAAGQAIMVLFYLGGYLIILARVDRDRVVDGFTYFHFGFSIISPIAQLLRATMLSLNLFGVLCSHLPAGGLAHPSGMETYGGPILYLVIQSVLLFSFLVWQDYGFSLGNWRRIPNPVCRDEEDSKTREKEVIEEEERVVSSTDGLRVLHLSKVYRSGMFGKLHAVDDLSFGVKHGEVFGLLGPNGAGKSTTISLLRGDIKPSTPTSQLLLNSTSILHHRSAARQNLGVCPQYDAIDLMTVREHLAFYASIRGIVDVSAAVEQMIRSVGLQPFRDRLGDQLSGGNKRKLSLGIALIGGPNVLLLDEPSTGLDPLAKRMMWRILRKFRPERSILLTTHSMEEADALANRVGIVSKQLLDIGTTEHLREKYSPGFHLHIVLESASQSTDEDMRNVIAWVQEKLPGTKVDGSAYHGQIHFNVPRSYVRPSYLDAEGEGTMTVSSEHHVRSVAAIFRLLEENKAEIGVQYYSVSRSMFDEVFLNAVNAHGVEEEDMKASKRHNLAFWKHR